MLEVSRGPTVCGACLLGTQTDSCTHLHGNFILVEETERKIIHKGVKCGEKGREEDGDCGVIIWSVVIREEGVGPEDVWGRSRQAEKHVQRPRANRSGVRRTECKHGVRLREDGGSGQGSRPQGSSEASR